MRRLGDPREAFRDREPVGARELDVEQDDFGPESLHRLDGGVPVRGCADHVEPFGAEQGGRRAPEVLVVVDDQDAARHALIVARLRTTRIVGSPNASLVPAAMCLRRVLPRVERDIERRIAMRKSVIFGVLLAVVLGAGVAGARPPGTNGMLTFSRFNPSVGDTQVYVVNPDGTRERLVQGATDAGECPRWFADGAHIAVCGSPVGLSRIINPDDATFRDVGTQEPGVFNPCGIPSPDGKAAPLRDVQRRRQPERHPRRPRV